MSAPGKPFIVDDRVRFTLPGVILISVIMVAGGVGIGWANLRAQVDEIPMLKVRVEDLEHDARKLDVIANDVQWIKQEMQRRRGAVVPSGSP